MNREILFRGKPMFRGSNNFVYGYYKKGDISGVETDFIFPLPEYKNEINEVAVLSKTIGQYTGLTDKNGTKIFGGDIIKWHDEWIDCDFVGVVEFDHCSAAFKVRVGNELIPFSDVDCEYVIKAGNIHDNPGLVGDTENEH